MVKGSQPPEMCMEADCADGTSESQSILVEADASPDHDHDVVDEPGNSEPSPLPPKRFSAPADGEISGHDSYPQNQPVNRGVPTHHGPRQHVHQQPPSAQHLMVKSSGIPFLVVVLAVSLLWFYCKQRKQQKEWQLSSDNQLDMIRQRNLQSEEDRESAPKTSVSKDKKLRNKIDAFKGKVESDAQQEIHPAENTVAKNKTSLSPKTDSNQSIGDNGKEVLKSKPSDHLSMIRAKQQEQQERNAKSSQQQRHQQQKKRKKILHNSLNHDVADEAHERRRHIIAQEESLLVQRELQRERRQGQEQQPLNELEEMERMTILQQQNIEYQESLLRDQERARQLALENEKRSRRETAIEQAKQRLDTAGVQNSSGITQEENTKGAVGNENKIRLRLLLPSGQRVEGKFASHHEMGLVYDLALIILDEEQLLWSQDGSDGDWGHDVEDSSHEHIDSTGDPFGDSVSSDVNDYNANHNEWKQIFYSFSLVSTFPQRTFDNLSLTLEDCGLSHSAMLMVVVESD